MSLQFAVLLGLASASAFKLIAVDRITRGPRYWVLNRLHKAGGWLPGKIMYLLGCPLCLPLWTAAIFYGFRNTTAGRWAIYILAGRMVAYALLRWLNETGMRDWPNSVPWPPEPDE